MEKILLLSIATSILLMTGCGASPMKPTPKDWKWDIGRECIPNHEVYKSMVIIFDASGSMVSELGLAKRAVTTYVGSIPREVAVGLVVFDAAGVRKLTDIGLDRDSFIKAIVQIKSGGGTPLGEAVEIAYGMLAKRSKELCGKGEYHLVIVTDGYEDIGSPLVENVQTILATSPIRITTIGFQIGGSHVLNRTLPQQRYLSAENEAELKQGLGKVLAEAE